MTNLPRLQLAFMHIDEPLPADFQANIATHHALIPRQQRKQKSRECAQFLLQRLFNANGLSSELLAEVQRSANGRPYLCHPNIDFNLSHSGDWVAVLFSLAKSKICVGIDIEHPQRTRDYLKLLRYYAPIQEIEALYSGTHLPELTSVEERFYLSWCLREAILKSQGVGIAKLSEVVHDVELRQITSAYCPSGKLFFVPNLPFHLAYFIEQEKSVLWQAEIMQWRAGQFQLNSELKPLIYQVN